MLLLGIVDGFTTLVVLIFMASAAVFVSLERSQPYRAFRRLKWLLRFLFLFSAVSFAFTLITMWGDLNAVIPFLCFSGIVSVCFILQAHLARDIHHTQLSLLCYVLGVMVTSGFLTLCFGVLAQISRA